MSADLPTPTPAEQGFRMPAEWELHRATWFSWPHNRETWPGAIDEVSRIWARLAAELATGEEVHILVNSETPAETPWSFLDAARCPRERVFLHRVPTDDAWMRDHGPTFLVAGNSCERRHLMVDWKFNAWGGKYPPWAHDDAVPAAMADILGAPRYCPGIVLEGGSIEVNGAGMVLVTESCLLNENRNPQLTREALEDVLRATLGVEHVVWLGDGIVGDDTDGHVDDISRFCGARHVVTVVEDDAKDENYNALRANLSRLEKARDQNGHLLEIDILPMPPAQIFDGVRLPASYANFYIGNDVVLVPTFRSDRDIRALDTLSRLFTDRRVLGVDACEVVRGLGTFHCITQQQPA